ncbi:alpha/beta hydrolase [Geodermatophilus sp. TF02-6]|uniref:alpha/beta fold hydrolase n=1 Tax=Geodermatophilus sp. TF02-6 TaxID=2250575 RepID=UPI000DE92622|nr:alpha/beta fold hydrolase [Geodermatophilus sp. TF02-6]RBY75792.1 alpha/beta hydrolase [Geodermatophilus sp. TF02-6]
MTVGRAQDSRVERRFDRVGTLSIHTRWAGDPAASGRPVVLVPGLGISGRYMVRLLRLLAADRPAVALDLPGIGRSSRPERPLTLVEMADVLVAWLDAVALERPALLGHSLGAQVVAHVADQRPARVSCLVLASPSRDPSARRPWQQALRLLRDAPREAPSLVPIAVTDYLGAGPWRMWRTLRQSLHTDAVARLSRLEHPTLVVRGERDPLVSAAWADTVTGLLRHGTLVTLPGAPHAVNYTTARALAAVVRPFLTAHAGGAEPDRRGR